MRKEVKYTYGQMNQDISKSKSSNSFYWEGKNIRIVTNENFGSVTNQKGNDLVLTLPTISSNPTTKSLTTVSFPVNNLKIIHTQEIGDKVLLFTTNENVDCLFLVEESSSSNYNITLLYIDQLGFTYQSQIESEGLIENDEAEKVYWVDGENDIRFINITDSSYLNKTLNEITTIPSATLLDPYITDYASGGNHKAGVIQYSYNLYNKYGAQTRVSGLSELVYLQNDDKGNPFDSDIYKSPIVQIDEIPSNFDYIRVYSIFYSSLDTLPKISLIYENENSSTSLTITDNNDIIQEIALSEFNIISTNRIIPKHINSKDGHLFFANYKTEKFDVDYDARAFAFNKTLVADPTADYQVTLKHADSKYSDYTFFETTAGTTLPGGAIDFNDVINGTFTIPDDHDCIIDDPDALWYADNPSASTASYIGGKGKNVKYTVNYKSRLLYGNNDPVKSTLETSLKRGEKHRVGVVLYNDKGEESFTKWVADVKIPGIGEDGYEQFLGGVGGGNAQLAYITVELNNLPSDVVAYRLVKVQRKDKDKTIRGQGIINPALYQLENRTSTTVTQNLDKISANYIQRTFKDGSTGPSVDTTTQASSPAAQTIRGDKFQKPLQFNTVGSHVAKGKILSTVSGSGEIYQASNKGEISNSKIHFNVYSPDITFSKTRLSINENFDINLLGFQRNIETYSRVDIYTGYDLSSFEFKDIDLRKTFTFSSTDSTSYLFQIDEAPDVGGDEDTYVDNFFNITSPGGAFVNLIGSDRFVFTPDTEDINTWEFKKVFYKRDFFFSYVSDAATNPSSIEPDTTVIYTPPILNSVAITTKASNAAGTAFIDSDSVYDLYTEIQGATKMSSYGGSSIFFTSTDLQTNANDYFDNHLTAGQKGTDDFALLVEFQNRNINQYGGNTYVDRQRNVYIPMSEKQKVGVNNDIIDSKYGDTFIQRCALLRVFQNNQVTGDIECGITEVVEFVCESSINNDMRYDTLKDETGKQTLDENISYGYNPVYQQESTLIKSLAKPFNLSDQETFRSEIIASPVKLLGEYIDNWTAISVNDKIILDTRHGAITGLTKMMDNLYAFQKDAVAYISVNPRVQLSASDGVPITVGSGQLLERYDYISTVSGTLHPKSIISTQNMIFYFDLLNNSINRISSQQGNNELSTIKGLYNYIKEYSVNNHDSLLNDINKGALVGYHNVNSVYDDKYEDIYFTFKTSTESFTVGFNLLLDGFTSFYDFVPNTYFIINNKLFSSDYNNQIWEHDRGLYNYFYNIYYPSSITILFNPEPDDDKILDTIGFIQDTVDISSGEDAPFIAVNKIKVDNAYQTTGEIDLTIGQNLRRKFREYNAIIPRENGTRNRIRSPYALIELKFNQSGSDYKFTLYDIKAGYTIN